MIHVHSAAAPWLLRGRAAGPTGWAAAAGTSLTACALSPAAGNGMLIAKPAEPVAGYEISRPLTRTIGPGLDGDFRTRLAYRIEIR